MAELKEVKEEELNDEVDEEEYCRSDMMSYGKLYASPSSSSRVENMQHQSSSQN